MIRLSFPCCSFGCFRRDEAHSALGFPRFPSIGHSRGSVPMRAASAALGPCRDSRLAVNCFCNLSMMLQILLSLQPLSSSVPCRVWGTTQKTLGGQGYAQPTPKTVSNLTSSFHWQGHSSRCVSACPLWFKHSPLPHTSFAPSLTPQKSSCPPITFK